MTEEKKILFFDTETSGFIRKALSPDDPEQAWVIQIGALLATEEEQLDELNLLIKPVGRYMHPEAEKIHEYR